MLNERFRSWTEKTFRMAVKDFWKTLSLPNALFVLANTFFQKDPNQANMKND